MICPKCGENVWSCEPHFCDGNQTAGVMINVLDAEAEIERVVKQGFFGWLREKFSGFRVQDSGKGKSA